MHIIEKQEELENTLKAFQNCEFITIDTEFIREETFWPQLCLIQIASHGQSAIIDPLSPSINLSPFLNLMIDKRIVKVFHAGRQDLEIIFNLAKFLPEPVFDTQIAAMACGFGEEISYDKLLYAITNLSLDKSLRFTNWQKRPLPYESLAYALADVTGLVDIYVYLKKDLERRNRSDWLDNNMSILSSPETYDFDPERAWKRLKTHARNAFEFALLRSVAAWRERHAQKRNVPRNRIMKDNAIHEICRYKRHDLEMIKRIRAIPEKLIREGLAIDLLECINQTLSIPEKEMPPPPSVWITPPNSRAKAELLSVLLRLIAEEEEVTPTMIATRAEIEQLAVQGEKAPVPALEGWRLNLFGLKALAVLRGEIAFKLEKNKIVYIES